MKNFLLLFLSISLFLSCDNNIELNAPYKQTAVIYGFLDQNDPVQYIRIQKTYQNALGSTANQGGQISDSLYFKNLKVTIYDVSFGYKSDTFTCVKIDSIPKNAGTFASDKHYLYVVVIPKNDSRDVTYLLEVKDTSTGNIFTSITPMVHDAKVQSGNINYTNSDLWVFTYRYSTAKFGYLYDAFIRFTYKEMSVIDTNIFSIKYVDYSLQKGIEYSGNGGEGVNLTLKGKNYIDNVLREYFVESDEAAGYPGGNTNVKRRFIGIEYVTYGGSDEFKNLLQISAPSLSIVQKKPEYSNITNGLGIFTSRNRSSNDVPINISQSTITQINSFLRFNQ